MAWTACLRCYAQVSPVERTDIHSIITGIAFFSALPGTPVDGEWNALVGSFAALRKPD